MVKVLYPMAGAPAAGVNAVQIITVGAGAVPYYLRFRGRQTASKLAVDASAATVQAALRALSSINGANITVAGSAGGPYTATFSATLASEDLPLIDSSTSKVTIVHSVRGSHPTGYGLGKGAVLATDEPAAYLNFGDEDSPDLQALVSSPTDGLRIARGVHTQVAASDTVVTGLTTVVAVLASFAGPGPTVKQLFCRGSIGDQAGTPAAGSILLTTYKPTAVNDVTPVAATDFTDNVKIAWFAVGL